MSIANIHDQSMRYHNLRQGEKEYISEFKIRFDHQVQSNMGAGMPDISKRLRAMDFIGKLDFKSYNGMLTRMRNCACQNLPGSYPKTLSAAYRTASTWTRDGLLVPLGGDSHSAFLAGTAFVVTKGKDSKAAWRKKRKRIVTSAFGQTLLRLRQEGAYFPRLPYAETPYIRHSSHGFKPGSRRG
jgi:hypothetical protein